MRRVRAGVCVAFVYVQSTLEIAQNFSYDAKMDDLLNVLVLGGILLFVFLVTSKPRRNKKRRTPRKKHGRKVVHFGENRRIETGVVRWQEPEYKKKLKPKPIKQPVSTEPIVGKCWVIDGDTIHIRKHKIRFQGMNAPELDEPYGEQAKWELHKLVKGQTITAKPNGERSHDRIVAKCFLEDGTDLGAKMVEMGLALDLPEYPDADYRHLETPASRKKLSWKPPKKKETEE